MPQAPKPTNMAVSVIRASEELIRVAGRTTGTPRAGAAALALALGRVCTIQGVNLEAALALVRLAQRGEDPRALARPHEEE